MAGISKDGASERFASDGFEGRYQDLGGYTVAFETYTADSDPATLFRGLPNDRCQSPHWGVVLSGTLVYSYDDGTRDEIGPGQAYYARPGHLPEFRAGTELVEFSPTAELAATMAVVSRNLEEAGA